MHGSSSLCYPSFLSTRSFCLISLGDPQNIADVFNNVDMRSVKIKTQRLQINL